MINGDNLEEFVGIRKHSYGIAEVENRIGMVTGLAWTSVGGELLTIESAAMRGKGQIVKTGSLGDVMQESIAAATTVVRTRAQSLGLLGDFNQSIDLHIHVPEGATPKDGPSAGIAMVTAMTSVLTNIPVRADVAMTGEITLRGEVLPIGGLKEKLLAARRGGIKVVLIPDENTRDLKEVPDNIKENLDIRPVKNIDEVLSVALESKPVALSDEDFNRVQKTTESENKGESNVNRH
jgi:ATP-dependent Lon protease